MRVASISSRASFVVSIVLALGQVTGVAGAPPYEPDTPEPGSIELIRQYTTAEEYLPESVSYVPDSETVPSPQEILGHIVGAPDELTRTAGVHDYFRKLAAASPRVTVQVIGHSEEGREILLALIADEESLEDLNRIRDITRRLADPRQTDRAAMQGLVHEGKVVYYLLGGLHSTETGSPEMLMELAYRLAVSDKPQIRDIRQNLVVAITPVCEPDGRDRVVDWYYRHLRGRDLPYEELRKFRSPPYWGHYVYHDNNRDGMQLRLALTRAVHGTYYDFHPQVVHDLHESLPLLYISTGHGPYSDAIDPVTINEWTQFAHHEAANLQAQGLPGVWVWGFWDGWWPGYLFSVANNHNSVGRFYETFGNTLAGTFERDTSERKFVGKSVTEEQWYRPWPPDKKVSWSMRNNTNYMQAGVLEALHYAALHRESLLRNFWVKGRRAMDLGRTESPHAWIFPDQQRDPSRLYHLLNLLRAHRIEVHRLQTDFELGDMTWQQGSYVVRLDQPYRNAIVNFLDKQEFPKNEPNPPYDDVAWTWPLLFGVDAERIDDDAVLDASMSPVQDAGTYEGAVRGRGEVYLMADTGRTNLLAARFALAEGFTIEAARQSFAVGDDSYPAGSWILRRNDADNREQLEDVARRFGIDFRAAASVPDVPRHPVDLPRLAVLHTWTSTQDCGWVRYALDRDAIPYTLISPDDLRHGRLGSRFDVIVFPTTRGDLKRIVHGLDPEFGPLAYTPTPEYASLGVPNASQDITGGMGLAGMLNLEEFVHGGGVLVALGNAGTLPVDGGIVRRVNKTSLARGTPGSEVSAKFVREDHPIAYGFEEFTSVFRGNLPVWDVAKHDRDLVVLQFGSKDVLAEDEDEGKDTGENEGEDTSENENEDKTGNGSVPELVLSGYVKDPSKLDGLPAILDVPVERGRVILFSFNPMHRYLNLSDFRLLYNVVLYWNDMPFPESLEAIQAVSRRRGR